MRKILVAAAMALAASVAGAASADSGLGRRFQVAITGPIDAALFDEAVRRVANAERAAHGRAPLAADARLARAAAGHAHNMASLHTHSHRLPVSGQGRLVQRMDRNGVDFRAAAENIAMEKVLRLLGRPIAASGTGCSFAYADTGAPVPTHTYESLARSAVARWMASPGHRASLLSAQFRRAGAGFAIDRQGPACGDVYLAQTFAD